MCRGMTKRAGRCKPLAGTRRFAILAVPAWGRRWPDRKDPVRAEGATAPVNSQANGPRGARTLWREMRAVRIRRRDNDLRRKDRGGILRRRFGAFTMPGCLHRRWAPEDGVTWTGRTLKHLPLRALHEELGGSFVPFAGWEMPVRYGPGVMAEHLWCREKAGLFRRVAYGAGDAAPGRRRGAGDVGADGRDRPQAEGRQRYAFFTNDAGGLLDDLMIARHAEGLHLVVNAACAEADIAHLERHVPSVDVLTDRALLALAGADGGGGAGGIGSGGRGHALHGCDAAGLGRYRALGLAVGLHRGGRVRDLPAHPRMRRRFARKLMDEPRRRAHWPRRARYAAAGGRVAALRAGPRARNHAGRGGTEHGPSRRSAAQGVRARAVSGG
jgi:hypothetical protein